VPCELCGTVVRRAGMEEHLADPGRAGGHMMKLLEKVRAEGWTRHSTWAYRQ
jgi:hypothetical protein